jgi:Septum formation
VKYRVAMGVAAIVVGGLTGCSSREPGPQSAATSAQGHSPASTFEVGDCIEDIKRPLNEVTVVDCAKPHADEVYAVFLMPDGPFPGTAVVQEFKDKCNAEALAAYSAAAAHNPVQHTTRRFPDEKSWAAGDRSVTCMIASDPPTTGSVRGR